MNCRRLERIGVWLTATGGVLMGFGLFYFSCIPMGIGASLFYAGAASLGIADASLNHDSSSIPTLG
jgi:hypothetical protein